MKKLDLLADNARVWIYQASRQLTLAEVEMITDKGAIFINGWSSHGASMDAALQVFYNRLVVIAADEQRALASGCGIDKSVRFMQELGQIMGVDFFQRTQVLFKTDQEWAEKPMHEFWAMRKAGLINDETMVLDNTIKNLSDLKTKWEVPFKSSWHAEMWTR